jgi:hypothetical protein
MGITARSVNARRKPGFAATRVAPGILKRRNPWLNILAPGLQSVPK